MACCPAEGDLRQHGSFLNSAESLLFAYDGNAGYAIGFLSNRFVKGGGVSDYHIGEAGEVLTEMIL